MRETKNWPVGVLTVSDRCSAGTAQDRSGPLLADGLEAAGYAVVRQLTVPDDLMTIHDTLLEWSVGCVLILTTGGTGFSPRDVTPEATLLALDRKADGIPELLRAEGRKSTPFSTLSRGVAGMRGRCIIVNLPGNPKAVAEGLALLLPILKHALALQLGDDPGH